MRLWVIGSRVHLLLLVVIVRHGNTNISDFATGKVRNVNEDKSSWQRGDGIVEPQGVYRLANGKLVLSRECSE